MKSFPKCRRYYTLPDVGSNAISGVVIIGAIILIRQASPDDYLTLAFGTLGVALGMTNVVGGFAVTDRMLEMFKKRKSSR